MKNDKRSKKARFLAAASKVPADRRVDAVMAVARIAEQHGSRGAVARAEERLRAVGAIP